MRQLVVDLAKSLHTDAVVHSLVRTRQAQFGLDDCLQQNEWSGEALMHRLAQWEAEHAAPTTT